MPTATAPQPLQKIDASQRAEIIEAIKRDGAVIVKNFTSQEKVDQVNAEVRPHLDADKPWKGALFAPEVRRCNRLVARSKTFRDTWLVDPLVTEVTEHFLNKTTSCWYDDQKHTYTSKPIVNAAITIEVRPGTDKQRLHRDDKVHHVEHPDQTLTGYRVGTDMSMTLFVAGTQTTKQNGATLVVPGSHLWDMERYPTPEEVIYAEMMPGELYMMLGGTYHAGGANQTLNQNRPMHGMWFCRGYLRNEENPYLGNPKEDVLSWSEEVQRKMGFFISSPNLGFVDFRQPLIHMTGKFDPDFNVDLDPIKETVIKDEATSDLIV